MHRCFFRNFTVISRSRWTAAGPSVAIVVSLLMASTGLGQEPHSGLSGVRARLQLPSSFVDVGRAVWVDFIIENQSDEPVKLVVPGVRPVGSPTEMGLPLSHLFSGVDSAGPLITDEAGRRWSVPMGYLPGSSAPVLVVGARSSVSKLIDLTQYYHFMKSPGRYRIQWEPYGGLLSSGFVVVDIAPLKQAQIQTDQGTMTINFYYDDAPITVANFLELAGKSFYNNTHFHRISPGHMIVGGCPIGNGTGIRTDGKKIPPEFNARQHRKGSVSMALLNDDPRSASCQFFICNTRQPEWDGKYTVFGQLEGDESFETLDRLMATPVDEEGRPQGSMPLVIRGIRIINAPRNLLDDAR